MDNNSFEISPETYLFPYRDECVVLIEKSNDVFWVLGMPFLREYYTVYDMENLEVLVYKSNKKQESSKSYGILCILLSFIMIPTVYAYSRFYRNPRKAYPDLSAKFLARQSIKI